MSHPTVGRAQDEGRDRALVEKRVLLLRYHSLGDVILTTGVARAVAAAAGASGERCRLEVATEPRFRPVFDGLEWIDRVWNRSQVERAVRGLAEVDGGEVPGPVPFYDQVIDLQGTPGSRRLSRRLGPSTHLRSRALQRRWLVFWGDRFPRPRIPHVLERYAEVAGLVEDPGRPSLRPEVRVTSEEARECDRMIPAALAQPPGSAVVCVAGASRRSKEYPRLQLERVAALLERAGRTVWWVEAPDAVALPAERAAAAEGAAPGPTRLVARLPLGPLKALLSRAALVIASDSGPMHLASAAGTPVLALFGSSAPAFGFTPSGARDRVLAVEELACRPCGVHGRDRCWLGHWRCLRDLRPARVAEEALEMLRVRESGSDGDEAGGA